MVSSRKSELFVTIAAVAVLLTSSHAQGTSPLNGTWNLNVAKSKYDPPILTPKSSTVRFEIKGDTVKGTIDSVDAQGRTVHTEYTATLDGKDHPIKSTVDGKPNPSQDAVSWKKIDERTFEITSKLKGQVVATQRTVVSADGKTRTTTTTGKNAQGLTVSQVAVFEKK